MEKKIIFIVTIFFILLAFLFVTGKPEDGYLKEINQATDWTTPVNISNTPGYHSEGPFIGVDSKGNAYVVWTEYEGLRKILFNTNKSGQWPAPIRVATIYYGIDDVGFPSFVTTPDGKCHMAYHDAYEGSMEILYCEYENNWTDRKNISQTPAGGSAYVSLRLNPVDNFLYAVWMDATNFEFEMIYRSKDPATKSWGSIETIPLFTGGQYLPDLVIDGKGAAHLVWMTRGAGNSTVWYTKNPNPKNYTLWTDPVLVQANVGVEWSWPRIAADKTGNVYVIWTGNTQGNLDVYLRKKINEQWQPTENISKDAGQSEQGCLAVDQNKGTVYAAWADNTYEQNWEILLKSYQDGTWSDITNISKSSGNSSTPSLCVDEMSGVHIAYGEEVGGKWDIKYSTKPGRPRVFPPVNLTLATELDESLSPPGKTNTIRWQNNPENKPPLTLMNYKVYRQEVGQKDFTYLTSVGGDILEYKDKNLSTAKKYTYALTAVAEGGYESEISASVTEEKVFPPLQTSLETVFNNLLFYKEKINIITFNKNPLNEAVTVAKYKLYQKKLGEDDKNFVLIATLESSVFEYRDRHLPLNEKFSYALSTVDSKENESKKSQLINEQ